MNKKLLLIIALSALFISFAYFSYQYYLKVKRPINVPSEKSDRIELSREEMQKIIDRNMPEISTKELTEKDKQKILERQ